MLSFVRLFVLLCLSVAAVGVQAQAWPAKTIRVVVNFPAGGTTDMMARATTSMPTLPPAPPRFSMITG